MAPRISNALVPLRAFRTVRGLLASPAFEFIALVEGAPLDTPDVSCLDIFDVSGIQPKTAVVEHAHEIGALAWHPSKPRLAALVDRRLLIIDPSCNRRQLVPVPDGFVVVDMEWLSDTALLFAGGRDEGKTDLYSFDLLRGSCSRLVRLAGNCRTPKVAANRRLVAFVEVEEGVAADAARSRLWILDLVTGSSAVALTGYDAVMAPTWRPHGRALAILVRNAGIAHWSDSWRVAVLSTDRTTVTTVTSGDLNFGATMSREPLAWVRQSLLAAAPYEGALRLWDVLHATPISHSGANEHVVDFAVTRRDRIAKVVTWPNQPPRVRITDLDGRARATIEFNAKLAEDASMPTVLRLSVRHGDPSPEAFVLVPREGHSGTIVMDLHGGPHGFHPNPAWPAWIFTASLVGEGHTVILPNPRGSTGYGLAFQRAVVADWAGVDALDVNAMLDAAQLSLNVPNSRVGISGWSYGGYLAAWLMTTSSRFGAAAIGCPMTDLVAFANTCDIPDYCEHEFGEARYARSPLRQVHSHVRPVLLLHGTRDRRCPIAQSEVFEAALRSVGTTVHLVRYDTDEHLLTRPDMVIDRVQRTLNWFRRYLA